MGKTLEMGCPYCLSQKVIRNGHPHSAKLEFFCKSCHKYFYENTAKGYPRTNIPFPVIAYLLYFRKRIPCFSKMREFRSFASQLLKCLGIKKEKVSRQIIHHWIKNYESGLEKIIRFEEARDHCHKILSEKLKSIPEEVIRVKSAPHKIALRVLEDSLGHSFCVDLIHRDEVFFDELCELVSKYEVYCWELLDKEQLRRSNRLFLVRSLKDVKRLKC